MSDCLFPTCTRHAESNGYCIGHRIYASGTVVKTKTEIPKVGVKQKSIIQALKTTYPSFLTKHPLCEIKAPGCTQIATVVHHIAGRGKNEVLDQTTWKASCIHCNQWIEENHAKAQLMGVKTPRHHRKTNV